MTTTTHGRPPGRLTILQARGKRLTKVYEHGLKGKVVKRGYDKALWFTSRSVEVKNVDALADLLRQLQRHPDACVIMGVPGKWHPGEGRPVLRRVYASHELADDSGRIHKEARKGTAEVWQRQQVEAGRLRPVTVLPAFEEQATRVLLLDFDGISAPAGIDWRADFAWTAAFLRLRLPAEFHGCRCVHYATSSAADLTKPDLGGTGIRMRLGFMLDRGVSFAQAKRWLAGIDGLDACTLRPAQPIYTAAPLFRDGLVDPLPERLGMLDGERELVAVPEITIEQRLKREAFASLGPVRSAEGLGLLKSPRLDAALVQLADTNGEAGGVRSRLMAAAFDYAKDVGRDHVDVDALAGALAEAASTYRSADEVAGYGLEGMIAWALERSPAELPRPHYPDNGRPVEEAAARVKMEIAASVGAAGAWTATASVAGPGTVVDPPPVAAIKADAGSGKTSEVIAQIAAIPGVEQMYIEIYVPDHRLAEELAEQVRDLVASRRPPDFVGIDTNAELRVLVIRGRGALDVDGEPMCEKGELD